MMDIMSVVGLVELGADLAVRSCGQSLQIC